MRVVYTADNGATVRERDDVDGHGRYAVYSPAGRLSRYVRLERKGREFIRRVWGA